MSVELKIRFLKIKNLIYLTIISIINIIYLKQVLASSSEDEQFRENEKLIRLNSCIKLINIMIKEDKDYLPFAFKTFFSDAKSSRKYSFDQIYISMKDNILQGCYSEMSIIKAAELTNLNVRAVNPFTKENKKLTSPEFFKEKYPNLVPGDEENERLKESEYSKDYKKMNSLIVSKVVEIKELPALEETIATFVDSNTNGIQKEYSTYLSKSKIKDRKENQNRKANDNYEGGSDAYLDESEYSNLNLSIFGVNLTDPKIKNTLGLFLLFLVFVGIYLSYRAVRKTEPSGEKKKKKKNKDE